MNETSKKLKALTENSEDFEWYPTTGEILSAMNKDLRHLFVKDNLADNCARNRGEKLFSYSNNYDRGKNRKEYTYYVNSFLDAGTGDGRVFDAISGADSDIVISRRYGIEKAKAQADGLINRGVFIIGRDFWKTSLYDKEYAVIFSNPPYSQYRPWTEKLFRESNFGVMYLVLPVRWHETLDKRCGIELYDVKILGEFDFHEADRAARAKVNLIRVTHKKKKVEDRYQGRSLGFHTEFGDDKEPDSFDRWIRENIGTFEGKPEENEDEKTLKLRGSTVTELVESFEKESRDLLDLFKSIGNTPIRVIQALDIDRKSILELIRKEIGTLKKRYWRIAFDMLDGIKSRLVHETRSRLLEEIDEFSTLDFNEENIYSIIVWVVKHFNEYTGEQLLSVFDALTSQDYIKAYKSNVHWTQDNWRYTGKGKPEKYQLDYRLVTHCYKSYRWEQNTVDDFIVICRSLGYHIPAHRDLNQENIGGAQDFYTTDGELAFTVRLYKNRNAHLKINQKLMMKFNIEVARLRHWINSHQDIQDEFDVSPVEAYRLWNASNVRRLEMSDIKLLGFDDQAEEPEAQPA
jgi:hypothetical protein